MQSEVEKHDVYTQVNKCVCVNTTYTNDRNNRNDNDNNGKIIIIK